MDNKEKIVLILQTIIKNCDEASNSVKGISYNDFIKNIEKMNSVSFNIIQIGEFAKRIPKDFIEVHGDIDWKSIAGARDFLAHHYDMIKQDVLWKTATIDVIDLKGKIEAIIGKL